MNVKTLIKGAVSALILAGVSTLAMAASDGQRFDCVRNFWRGRSPSNARAGVPPWELDKLDDDILDSVFNSPYSQQPYGWKCWCCTVPDAL